MKKKLLRPVCNRKGIGIVDTILIMLVVMLVAYGVMYLVANMLHNSVTSQLNMYANSEMDVITENRKISNNVHSYYKEKVESLKFYTGQCSFVYKIYEYNKDTDELIQVNSIEPGVNDAIETIKLTKNQIVRVLIISDGNTMLARMGKLLGSDKDNVECIGVAEGGVE